MKRGYTKREARRRRTKFMILEGMWDFAGTIAGFFVILICVVLLTTLISGFTFIGMAAIVYVRPMSMPSLSAWR